MFRVILIFGVMFLCVGSFAGNEGSGGGDIRRSTKADVLEALNWPDYIIFLWEIKSELQNTAPVKINDPQARKLFLRIAALPEISQMSPTTGWPKDWKIEKQMEDPCYDPNTNAETDASVSQKGSNAIFCFSVPRLTRYPKSGLHSEIGALMVHEIGHAAGLDEDEARAVQEYVLVKMFRPCEIQIPTPFFNSESPTTKEFASVWRIPLRNLSTFQTLTHGYQVDLYSEILPVGGTGAGEATKHYSDNRENLKISLSEDHSEMEFHALNTKQEQVSVRAQWGEMKPSQFNSVYYDLKDLNTMKVFVNGATMENQGVYVSRACFSDE